MDSRDTQHSRNLQFQSNDPHPSLFNRSGHCSPTILHPYQVAGKLDSKLTGSSEADWSRRYRQGAIVADGIVGCYPSPNQFVPIHSRSLPSSTILITSRAYSARIWEVVLYCSSVSVLSYRDENN